MRSPPELWREAEELRASLPQVLDDTSIESYISGTHILRNVYKEILLLDLDYALDKKIEQELWNTCFKNPIAKLQPVPKDLKGKKLEPPTLLNWFLESAAGFYLILLQEICTQCDFDTSFFKRNISFGIFSGATYPDKPKDESCLYIFQHCIIHLGDLARYRNRPDEAEGYYKQAARVEPSSGHPYNQLALLEAARGNKLSTFFFYVRSISLKHPFPPASTNLEKLLNKQLTSNVNFKSRSRPTLDEVLSMFLKMQGQISLGADLEQAEQLAKLFSLTLPSLIAAEVLTSTQTVHMLAITMYTASRVKNEARKQSFNLAIDLAGSVLNACLVPAYTLEGSQLIHYEYLSVVKLVFDWLHIHPDVLLNSVICDRHQLWSAASKLLNELQISLGSINQEDGGHPLPEDLVLVEFLPLVPPTPLVNTGTMAKLDGDQVHLIRASRIVELGKRLAGQSSSSLTVTHRPSEQLHFLFESVQRSNPVEPPVAVAMDAPMKDVKILSRNNKPRNVALAAILKKTTEEPAPTASDSNNKQVKFQDPSTPPTPSSGSTSNGVKGFPRPTLPPRLERLKAEQRERDLANPGAPGSYPNYNVSIPPPPVAPLMPQPPPGLLGFPRPPPIDAVPAPWSLTNQFGSNSYSLFNSGLLPQLTPASSVDQRLFAGSNPLAPPSLWSGPGPSPLERLLEQQKALRSGAAKNMKN